MRLAFFALAPAAAVLAACAPTSTGPASPGPDQCRAAEYQHLIGQNRSAIPSTPAGATWRVTCTRCPVTMDYNPTRLNIFYDEASGTVREVKCG